jgi:hypothetical protein
MHYTTEPNNPNMLLTAGDFPVHRAANIVPLHPDFETLKESIKRSGQIDPISLFNGSILDGRRRAIVCKELGIAIRTDEINGIGKFPEKDIYEFVLAKNTHRSISKAQQAMIAAVETQRGAHSLMGISRATIYAKQVWGVGASSYDKARYILNRDTVLASEIFATGFSTIGGERYTMVKTFEYLKRKNAVICHGSGNGDPEKAKMHADLEALNVRYASLGNHEFNEILKIHQRR